MAFKEFEKFFLKEISNTNIVGFIAVLTLLVSYAGNSVGNKNILYKTSLLENNYINNSGYIININGNDYILTKK